MPDEVRADVKAILAFGEGAAPNASIDEYVPPDPRNFGVNLQVLIGETNSDRYDSFDVFVCTPSWMAERVETGEWEPFVGRRLDGIPESVVPGCGVWFVARWNEGEIREAIRVTCDSSSPGPDWGSVAARIGRSIPWEFDYRYDEHVNRHFGEAFPPIP